MSKNEKQFGSLNSKSLKKAHTLSSLLPIVANSQKTFDPRFPSPRNKLTQFSNLNSFSDKDNSSIEKIDRINNEGDSQSESFENSGNISYSEGEQDINQIDLFEFNHLMKTNEQKTKAIKISEISEHYLEGEVEIKRFQNVTYHYFDLIFQECNEIGVLIITNGRILFVSQDDNVSSYNNFFSIYIHSIIKIETLKGSIKSEGKKLQNGIDISCKQFQNLKFYFGRKNKKIRKEAMGIINNYIAPKNQNKWFSYCHKTEKKKIDSFWEIHNPRQEFLRQGIKFEKEQGENSMGNGNENKNENENKKENENKNEKEANYNDDDDNDDGNEEEEEEEEIYWKELEINTLYNFCSTYPNFLIVPSSLDKRIIVSSAENRQNERIPILRYYYNKNKASIISGSQLKTKIKKGRCLEDEILIEELRCTNSTEKELLIIHCRPKKTSYTTIYKGFVYESSEHYPHCKLIFFEIEDLAELRKSLSKLRELCFKTVTKSTNLKWWTSLEDTGWYKQIQTVLESSRFIADIVANNGISTFIQEMECFDRTCQLVSLAQLMIDPFYRTIKGFSILIEKEWCSFGYPFSQRESYFGDNTSENDHSPIFLQFIDCVYQILIQFPSAFEFNANLLKLILKHLYSGRFGTFLFNSELERVTNVLNQNTYSIWNYLEKKKNKYLNTYYFKSHEILLPSFNSRHLNFWEDYYLQFLSTTYFLSQQQFGKNNCIHSRFKDLKKKYQKFESKLENFDKISSQNQNNNQEKFPPVSYFNYNEEN
ncbi:myotubularin-related [Anaeramoeba flamelloides]|uniref:Myotubularin-related n=1 Tax=Anaeramoeba flamelloides TaxID=1746091 RepID=A0ABQ8YE33_9EUKA|nr:myotubularin-related [Anaeramoeba flamelloides]